VQDLNDLYYFVQVVDHAGFAPAARALGLQKSLLSRRVAALEDRLGARLLQRSSRRFVVTEIGREFHIRCTAMLEEARSAEQVVAEQQAAPRGIVRLSCPVGLLAFQFGRLLSDFMLQNPDVILHVEGINREVDVIAEGFDLAIRVRFPPLAESELVMRHIDESTQYLVAHPSLVPEQPTSPANLAGMPSLGQGPATQAHRWSLKRDDGQTAVIPFSPRLVTDDMNLLRRAALQGLGVVQLPTQQVWSDLAAGRLVAVLPDWRPRSGIIHAVFPSRRGLLPSVRALLDFLVRECAAHRRVISASQATPDTSG
jgi:DNA-binding transcriptional LysR family regulator